MSTATCSRLVKTTACRTAFATCLPHCVQRIQAHHKLRRVGTTVTTRRLPPRLIKSEADLGRSHARTWSTNLHPSTAARRSASSICAQTYHKNRAGARLSARSRHHATHIWRFKAGQVYNGVRTTGAVPLHSLIEAAQRQTVFRSVTLSCQTKAHRYGRCAPSLFTPTTRNVPYARPWRKAFIWP